jgi:hypothetical protein
VLIIQEPDLRGSAMAGTAAITVKAIAHAKLCA